MEINNILSLIGKISTITSDAKSISSALPLPIFLPPTRRSLEELKNKILSIEEEVANLKQKADGDFPELARLIRSYARLISDVRIAGALSDKAAEIYGLAPDLAPRFTTMFANERQNDFTRIESSIQQLSAPDITEKGKLLAKLSMIRDCIRDLKSISQDDTRNIKRLLDNISTTYSDIESVLSELLEKILSSLDPVQK